MDITLDTAIDVIRRIIDAGDKCRGHGDCDHSMQPWIDGRNLLRLIDEAVPENGS